MIEKVTMWKTSDGLLHPSEQKADLHEMWLQDEFPEIKSSNTISGMDIPRIKSIMTELHCLSSSNINRAIDNIIERLGKYEWASTDDPEDPDLIEELNAEDLIYCFISALKK